MFIMRTINQELFGAGLLGLGLISSGVALHEIASATPASTEAAEGFVKTEVAPVPEPDIGMLATDALAAVLLGGAILSRPTYNKPTVSHTSQVTVQQ